jgi:hypothetical protein
MSRISPRARLGPLAASAAVIALAMALAVVPAAEAKRFKGSDGADTIVGTKKNDKIKALAGDDQVNGRKGKDKVRGQAGADTLKGGKGRDRLKGGADADLIKAVDGKRDKQVNGGAGDDTCRIDQVDLKRVVSCETLEVVGGGGQTPADELPVTSATGLSCAQELPLCPFQIDGTGADDLAGTVTGGGGVSLAVGAGVNVNPDGSWTAAGLYGCTDDGFLTVTIGAKSVDVPITCETEPAPLP